eukprot:g10537.t1
MERVEHTNWLTAVTHRFGWVVLHAQNHSWDADLAGNASVSCREARSRWSDSCCAGPDEASEAEAHGEEATPFCKSLCLKTDVKDWNMTCEELQELECASTHFFQTISACERRLCVWSAPSCTVAPRPRM